MQHLEEETKPKELTTREIFRMLDEAKRLNFVAYVAWGGEPLLRHDIIDILNHAHGLGFYTSMITNGTLLKDRAKETSKIVDLTWVSLDYDSEYHSEMRHSTSAFLGCIRRWQDQTVLVPKKQQDVG